MQIAQRLGGAPFPPSHEQGAPLPKLAEEQRAARRRYRLLHLRRAAEFWWYRILLVILGGCLGVVLGQLAVSYALMIAGGLVAPIIIFWTLRRLEVGLIILGIFSSPLVPRALAVRSLVFYPVEAILIVLAGAIVVLAAFHVRKFVWPSFWIIWPQLGLVILAIVSEVIIQVTWVQQAPRKLNYTPVVYSELLGLAMYCVPLLTIIVTTACLSGKDHWITRLENALLIVAAAGAAIVCIEFKRIGVDVFQFRYTESTIFYMPLGALAQFIGLGAMIAYARTLYAERWRPRLVYGGLTLLCLLGIYFTLENSRWLFIAVALIVMTLVYSRRLFAVFCGIGLLSLPFALTLVNKLLAVKGPRDVNRLTIWRDMLTVWSKRPVFGVGPGNVWPYDQVFTHLPLALRNLSSTGLGVAHNGVIQTLTEVGPLGVLCYYAFAVAITVAAARLYLRSRRQPEKRPDSMLALICLGLICGSVVADFFAGIFFLPPAQVGGFNDLPRVLSTWIMFGCLIYKDQLWRAGRRLTRAVA